MSPALRRRAAKLGLMGRTKRTSILLFVILAGAAQVAFALVFAGEMRRRGPPTDLVIAAATAAPWIDLISTVAFLWLAWRRFQDHDKPGWLAILPTALAYATWLLPAVPFAQQSAQAGVLVLALMVLYLVGLLWPPTVGPNRYGADPRGWRSPEHYAEERRRGRAT